MRVPPAVKEPVLSHALKVTGVDVLGRRVDPATSLM
jgi:hypothetical protein